MVHTAEEVDQLTEHMRRAGARERKEPVDAEFFTGRSAHLCDPWSSIHAASATGESRRIARGGPAVRQQRREFTTGQVDLLKHALSICLLR